MYSSQLGTLADIAATLRRFGRLAGSEARPRRARSASRPSCAALRERYAGRAPLRVFYQIWHRPLLTVNDRHLISEGLRLCGARNVFGTLRAADAHGQRRGGAGRRPGRHRHRQRRR